MAHAREALKSPRTVVSGLKIENFKCIKSLDVELAPLTIFIGPNGSGKSSILEALALIAQATSADVGLRDGAARKGPLLSIEDKDALFCDKRVDDWLCLGLTVKPSDEERAAIQKALEEDRQAITALSEFRHIVEDAKEVSYVNKVSGHGVWYIIFINKEKIIEYRYEEGREPECYPKQLRVYPSLTPGEFLPSKFVANSRYLEFTGEISSIIRKRVAKEGVKYISAERGLIPWYREAGEPVNYVGRRGEFTLEILAELMKPENDERRFPYELLSKEFGIERMWVGWHRVNVLTSGYKDPWTGTVGLKFPLLGHGSRQLVPVIAQLAMSDPGDIIMVEEPEISLHPASQAKLPVLFGKAVMEGKQLLITTHSSYFPLSLPVVFDGYTLEGETTGGHRSYEVRLKPEDVAIYHVTRGSDGYTQVKRLELDENGLKEGIPSFIEVEKAILSRYLGGE